MLAFGILFCSTAIRAEVWYLPNGQTITTQAGSTPPVRGARRVPYPGQQQVQQGWGQVNQQPLLPQPQQSVQQRGQQPVNPARGVNTQVLGQGPAYSNCVLFARSRVPSLPYGLGNWNGKMAAINSRAPKTGSIAMIPYVDPATQEAIGHAAFVERVEGTSITLLDANWKRNTLTRRTSIGNDLNDAASLLRIAGYYQPRQ